MYAFPNAQMHEMESRHAARRNHGSERASSDGMPSPSLSAKATLFIARTWLPTIAASAAHTTDRVSPLD